MKEEQLYLPLKWDDSGINFLTLDEQSGPSRELEQLFQEVQEDDFLLGKTPEALPDSWEEEE